MMKKFSALALVLLTAFGLEAGRKSENCCGELRGISGAALIDFANVARIVELPYCLAGKSNGQVCEPHAVALQANEFSVSVLRGCGFTVQPVCFTIRPLDAFAQVAFKNGNPYNAFTEVITTFNVIFDKPFKNVPAVTATLEILKPTGTGCPLFLGGSEIAGPNGQPLGYAHDDFIFLTNVTTQGFTLNLDAKFAAISPAFVTQIVAGLVSLGFAFDFHAIATK